MILWTLALPVLAFVAYKIFRRLQLSRAKHPSLAGHARMSRRLASQVPKVSYGLDRAFNIDDAPADIVARRHSGMSCLSQQLQDRSVISREISSQLTHAVSDMQLTEAYRVPFQFREMVQNRLPINTFASSSDGVQIQSLEGDWSFDLSGAYGVNLLGYDFYRQCIERGNERARDMGPVLGPYHPVVAENVQFLQQASGLDEVSFHMSGTEAVMQAVRLARYHTRKSKLVMFSGAYHGWWDGVQPGIGNRRRSNDILMLAEMSEATLTVLRTRHDIACVIVNPIQVMHPNSSPASDASLIGGSTPTNVDQQAYSGWLKKLRETCTSNGIALIFDEVFVGFRLGLQGAQGYFGIQADLVTYGKTVGGGLPVGVVCGKAIYMKRFREDRPTDLCVARGTFNSHPYVMTAMNEFLRYAFSTEFAEISENAESLWNERAAELNRQLTTGGYPLRVSNLASVWTFVYLNPSRYNWMYQYYLRAEGITLGMVGTGRIIFSHNFAQDDFAEVLRRILVAAKRMHDDGWWWCPADATNKSVRRDVMREFFQARLKRRAIPHREDMPAAEGSPSALS